MRSIELLFDRTPDPLRSTTMSVAFADPVRARPTPEAPAVQLKAAPVRPETAPVRVRPRRPGPGVGPAAHPRRLRFATPPVARPAGCRPVVPVVERPRSWRLTERGLAVVLVVAAALVAASVSVVALTALRVTGDGYHPGHSTVAAAPVQP